MRENEDTHDTGDVEEDAEDKLQIVDLKIEREACTEAKKDDVIPSIE